MENQEQKPQEQQTFTEPKRDYNPFGDNVQQRSYTQSNNSASADQMGGYIPEPQYVPQDINMREDPYALISGTGGTRGGGGGAPRQDAPPINPAMNDLSDSDKKLGAEHLAKLCVDGYEQLHVFGNKLVQFNERKLRKLQSEGEIDLSQHVPYEAGRTMSGYEFVQAFNEQSKDTLTVSKEFKKEVTPVLTRVLEKRGAGLTDEQYLGFLVAKDVAVKLVIISQMRGAMNDVIEMMKEAKKEGTAPSQPTQPQPTQPQPTQPTQPTPTYAAAPIVQTDADDFNFQTNEAVINASVTENKIPSTGKNRLMQQRQKEKVWAENAAKAEGGLSYAEAMKQRKNGDGKRGRKAKQVKDYITPIDEEQIAEAIVLRESKPYEKPNPQLEGLD